MRALLAVVLISIGCSPAPRPSAVETVEPPPERSEPPPAQGEIPEEVLGLLCGDEIVSRCGDTHERCRIPMSEIVRECATRLAPLAPEDPTDEQRERGGMLLVFCSLAVYERDRASAGVECTLDIPEQMRELCELCLASRDDYEQMLESQ